MKEQGAGTGRPFRFRCLGEVSPPEDVRLSLYKWGLRDSFHAVKFRFDRAFSALEQEQFFAGLFEQPEAVELLGGQPGPVRCMAKSCKALNSNFVDGFAAAGTIDRRGNFVERLPFHVDELEIPSRAHQLLCGVGDEGEEPPAAWPWREELLETLWAVFVLGGRYAQFEESAEAVRAVTHFFYKELVDCRLREGVCVLDSRFYWVEEARGRRWGQRWTRDLLAVVVNPALRTCFMLLNNC